MFPQQLAICSIVLRSLARDRKQAQAYMPELARIHDAAPLPSLSPSSAKITHRVFHNSCIVDTAIVQRKVSVSGTISFRTVPKRRYRHFVLFDIFLVRSACLGMLATYRGVGRKSEMPEFQEKKANVFGNEVMSVMSQHQSIQR